MREVLDFYNQFDDPIEAFRENQRKLQVRLNHLSLNCAFCYNLILMLMCRNNRNWWNEWIKRNKFCHLLLLPAVYLVGDFDPTSLVFSITIRINHRSKVSEKLLFFIVSRHKSKSRNRFCGLRDFCKYLMKDDATRAHRIVDTEWVVKLIALLSVFHKLL